MNELILAFQANNYNPSTMCISFMEPSESSANSSSGKPISSHSRMVSRFTEAAKAFWFILLVTDLALTEASFLSGYTSAVAVISPVMVSPAANACWNRVVRFFPAAASLCIMLN
jgi:hypothetical protein